MITRCIVITITITTIAADALEPRFRCTGFHCWPNFIPPHPHIVLVNMGMVWCDGLYHFGYTVIWDACTHLAVKEIQVHLRSEIGEEWFSLMYNKFIFHSAIETINTISGMTTIQILFFIENENVWLFLKAQNITIVPRDRSKRYSDSSFLITPLELLSLSSRVEEPFSHMILIPDPVYPLLCLFISPLIFSCLLSACFVFQRTLW